MENKLLVFSDNCRQKHGVLDKTIQSIIYNPTTTENTQFVIRSLLDALYESTSKLISNQKITQETNTNKNMKQTTEKI